MKPTTKAPEVEALITSITGVDRRSTIIKNSCAFCKTPNLNFRDELSSKEYRISGLCQNCQDSVFGGEELCIANLLRSL